MKSLYPLFLAISVIFAVMTNIAIVAQGLTLPINDAAIAGAIDTTEPIPYTAEEMATLPPGEIRKLRLRDISMARRALLAALASVPVEDQSNPNYSVTLSAAQRLEAVLLTRHQDQFFRLIEDIFTLEDEAELEGSPMFVRNASNALEEIKTSIVEEMADSIVRMDGTIPPAMLAHFVSAFAKGSLIVAGDWEDKVIPISSAGIMILNAEAVVSQLKSQPWQNAERFVRKATAVQAFNRYTQTGDGMEALRTKYAANQATIVAKWNELSDWVAQQRAANP